MFRDPRTRLYPFWYLTVMDKVNTVVYKSGNWLKKGRLANHVFWTFLNLWISFLHFLHFPNTSTSHFCKNRPERKWHLGAPFVILEFRNVFSFMAPQIHGQISPLFGTWFADMNQGIPDKDRNQYIAEQISCDIIIQNLICIPRQKSADRFCPWLSENVYIWKKRKSEIIIRGQKHSM